MKKIISSVIALLLILPTILATSYVGDTVTFTTDVNVCDRGYCGEPPSECNSDFGNDKQTCESFGCTWYSQQLSCDMDMSDNYGLWIFAGYALKDPDGNIVAQQNPQIYCNGDYSPSIQYTLNKEGTWKFCAKMTAYELSYANLQCSGNEINCNMENCVEVETTLCDSSQLEDSAFQNFINWINSW